MKFFSAIASLVACASAYQVLTPTANSTIAKGSNVNVEWSTVDTDPSTFSIYLVNFKDFPPTVLSLAQNVQQGAGSASVRIPCAVSSDYGWQLNFINGTNTYVIYAQSPVFSLTGECVDPTVSAAPVYSNASVAAVDVVQTIIYQNPVVWFVQPSNLIAAAAICPPASQQTVTVQVAGSAATVTKTVTATVSSCPSQAAIIAALAAAQGATASTGAAAVAASNATTNGTSVAATKSGVPVVTTLPSSTSGAAKIGGGAFLGLVAAFAALLL